MALAVMWAVGVSAAPAFDHALVARTALERHIRPGYDRFAAAAARLRDRMQALCDQPSEAHLAEATAAFRGAVLAWGGVEHLRFGPVTGQNRYERIVFWPDPKGIGRRQVARALKGRDETLLDPARLATKSVALQGLTALELVLHGSGASALSNPGDEGDFRCRYGRAIARNLSAIGQDIVSGWSESGPFARHWLAPGPDNPAFLDAKEGTRDLARAYIEGLQRVRDHRIAGPLGLGPNVRRKTRAGFERSGLAPALVTANVAGLFDLFVEGGLAGQLARRDPALVRSIRGELERVLEIGRSLVASGVRRLDDPAVADKLILMGFPLKTARESAGALLAEAAGLAIRFTDSDAD